jgi:hypothetical protein
LDVVAQQWPSVDTAYIDCLGALRPLNNVKRQILTLLKGLVLAIARLDTRVVHKYVGALLLAAPNSQETIAVNIVEPLTDANLVTNLVVTNFGDYGGVFRGH